jgi:hypothetical protein
MVGKFPEVLNFNWLSLKLNWFFPDNRLTLAKFEIRKKIVRGLGISTTLSVY